MHYPIEAVLSGVGGKVTKADEKRLDDYYLRYVAPADLRQKYAELRDLREESTKLEKGDPHHDGDGGTGKAARHIHSGARRLPEHDRKGTSRVPGRSAAAAAHRRTREPADARPVAGGSRRIR